MVNRNGTPVLTGIRNISYRWSNRYSLRYGIDSLDFNVDKCSFIFYFLGTIMQRKSNQWSQEHMKHNVSLGPLLHRKKMNGTED